MKSYISISADIRGVRGDIYASAAGPGLQTGSNNEEDEEEIVGPHFLLGRGEGSDSDGGPSRHYASVFISLFGNYFSCLLW